MFNMKFFKVVMNWPILWFVKKPTENNFVIQFFVVFLEKIFFY